MKTNHKLYIGISILVVLIIIATKPEPQIIAQDSQIIAPECFSREECRKPIPEKYCGIEYDCIVGKCYHSFTKCPEICFGGEDDDLDGYIDCGDIDCFDSIHCPCESASFNVCKAGWCYCPAGTRPYWLVWEDGNGCSCM